MNRDQLALLVKEYDERGEPLYDLLEVDRAKVSAWLGGSRIPRAQAQKLEWWASQLRVRKALEASGLPECEEARLLDDRATSAIMRKASSREQERTARAALEHAATCELCQKRDAVRKSAGPITGEPFPGYGRLSETSEQRASALWAFAIISWLGFAAIYAEGNLESGPELPWLMACLDLLMPWLFWEGVRRSRSNQIAAFLCVASGVVALFVTDFGALLANGWSFLLWPSVLIGIGFWIRHRR